MSITVGLHAAAQLWGCSTVLWGPFGTAGWPAQRSTRQLN